MTNPNF